jgi:hypothetical protein
MPVGYSVGKAIAKILSFPAASSIGVDRTSGAGRPGGVRLGPEISCRIRSISVAVTFRFGTMDWEFGGAFSTETAGPWTSSSEGSAITDINDEETSSSTGRVSNRSREIVTYR